MGTDYFIYYAEANIICILILSIVLISDRIYGSLQEKQVWFNRTLIAHILYFTSDIGWAAVLGGQLPRTRALVAALNFSNYSLLSLLAYAWFMYMSVSEKMPFCKDRKKSALCALPMGISLLTLLIAYAVKPYFWVNETAQLNSLYYPMLVAAPLIYLLVAFVLSVINAKKAATRKEKKIYRLIGIYPLAVLVSGVIQLTWMKAPLFCFGVTVMLLFFYIQNTQTLIPADALTRLNNRWQIIRYMEQIHYRENAAVFLMMIDIDRFKGINDTYGHAEGDRALMLVAEVLRQTCEKMRSSVFLGRYGGDEFAIILQNPEKNESPAQVVAMLRGALAEKQREQGLPYALEISIGYEELKDKNDTMQNCMIRADEKLYRDKRRNGRGK